MAQPCILIFCQHFKVRGRKCFSHFLTLEGFYYLLLSIGYIIFLAYFPHVESACVPTLWYHNISHVCSLGGVRVVQNVFSSITHTYRYAMAVEKIYTKKTN